MSDRKQQLSLWLNNFYNDYQLELVFGDASFRRYFRVMTSDARYIAMDAPPEHEDVIPYIDIAQRLHDVGLQAPIIVQQNIEQGFLLLEDLGDVQFLSVLNEDSVERLYGDALGALSVMQSCVSTDDLLPYDNDLLMREMSLFPDWLLTEQLGINLSDADKMMLQRSFQQLADAALEQPSVFVHRDYHSRNLMKVDKNNPGILDFQDAVKGPVTYDLVSLLKDCYISWPREKVLDWANGYFELAVQSGILKKEHEDQFIRWFDLMGVQRHLKAAGIFARLNKRDNKPAYLKDVPRTLAYIVAIGAEYPELKDLSGFIDEQVLAKLT